MPFVRAVHGKMPRIAASAYVADNATLLGDVELMDEASVWFGCVLRGDDGSIRIGARSNIQDMSCIHLTSGVSNTIVGEDVTVGHGVILHGCTIGDRVLVGMGSILLDNVVVGAGSVIGAGSLLTPRTVIPAGKLVLGRPGKVIRDVTPAEAMMGIDGARHYVENARAYRRELTAKTPRPPGEPEILPLSWRLGG